MPGFHPDPSACRVGGAFTGNHIALYSVGNGRPCVTEARFDSFAYKAL